MDLHELIEALTNPETATEALAGLTDEQLAEFDTEIVAAYQSIRAGETDGVDAEDLSVLQPMRDARAVIRGELAVRAEAAPEAEPVDLSALDADMAVEDEAEEPAAEEEAEEAEVEAEAVPEPVAVAAAPKAKKATMRQLAAAKRPAEAEPRPTGGAKTEARWRLQDGTQVDLDNKIEVAKRVIAATESLVNTPKGFRDKVNVATFTVKRPDEMYLAPGADPVVNQGKIDRFVAPALDPTPEMRSLTASGGWCAPGEPRYDIPSFASAVRPFRDALPRMGSTRGTVNFVRAARLSTILANQAGAAVTNWENTTDEVPGESTKTRQTHACRTIQEEEVGAIVARMRFGNFQQRAFPEDVAHDLDLVAARHARVAERRLIDALIADVNIDVTQTGFFGTARDIRFALNQAAREIRYTERMGRARAIRCAVESTILDMVQSDVVNQTASGEVDALLVDEAFARRLIALSTVDPIYMEDTPTGADEWVTNADTQTLADYPDNFEIPVFPDGSAVFVDAGELNVGIVRDSTLNNTNDYEIFYETFEGLLWLGPYAKTLTLTTCPTGDSQLPNDVTTICSGS